MQWHATKPWFALSPGLFIVGWIGVLIFRHWSEVGVVYSGMLAIAGGAALVMVAFCASDSRRMPDRDTTVLDVPRDIRQ